MISSFLFFASSSDSFYPLYLAGRVASGQFVCYSLLFVDLIGGHAASNGVGIGEFGGLLLT